MKFLPSPRWAMFALLLMPSVPGCASKQATVAAPPPPRLPQNPALTLPSADLSATADIDEAWGMINGGWEDARNDANLGATGSPLVTEYEVAEIRHYEFLRTTNGRPRNDTWTHSRSYERRSGP